MKPKIIFDEKNLNHDFLNLEFRNVYDNMKDIKVITLTIPLKINKISINYQHPYPATKDTQVFVNIESSTEKVIVYVSEITEEHFTLKVFPVGSNFTTDGEVKLKCLIIK